MEVIVSGIEGAPCKKGSEKVARWSRIFFERLVPGERLRLNKTTDDTPPAAVGRIRNI
jgi:hypothetical protein